MTQVEDYGDLTLIENYRGFPIYTNEHGRFYMKIVDDGFMHTAMDISGAKHLIDEIVEDIESNPTHSLRHKLEKGGIYTDEWGELVIDVGHTTLSPEYLREVSIASHENPGKTIFLSDAPESFIGWAKNGKVEFYPGVAEEIGIEGYTAVLDKSKRMMKSDKMNKKKGKVNKMADFTIPATTIKLPDRIRGSIGKWGTLDMEYNDVNGFPMYETTIDVGTTLTESGEETYNYVSVFLYPIFSSSPEGSQYSGKSEIEFILDNSHRSVNYNVYTGGEDRYDLEGDDVAWSVENFLNENMGYFNKEVFNVNKSKIAKEINEENLIEEYKGYKLVRSTDARVEPIQVWQFRNGSWQHMYSADSEHQARRLIDTYGDVEKSSKMKKGEKFKVIKVNQDMTSDLMMVFDSLDEAITWLKNEIKRPTMTWEDPVQSMALILDSHGGEIMMDEEGIVYDSIRKSRMKKWAVSHSIEYTTEQPSEAIYQTMSFLEGFTEDEVGSDAMRYIDEATDSLLSAYNSAEEYETSEEGISKLPKSRMKKMAKMVRVGGGWVSPTIDIALEGAGDVKFKTPDVGSERKKTITSVRFPHNDEEIEITIFAEVENKESLYGKFSIQVASATQGQALLNESVSSDMNDSGLISAVQQIWDKYLRLNKSNNPASTNPFHAYCMCAKAQKESGRKGMTRDAIWKVIGVNPDRMLIDYDKRLQKIGSSDGTVYIFDEKVLRGLRE